MQKSPLSDQLNSKQIHNRLEQLYQVSEDVAEACGDLPRCPLLDTYSALKFYVHQTKSSCLDALYILKGFQKMIKMHAIVP